MQHNQMLKFPGVILAVLIGFGVVPAWAQSEQPAEETTATQDSTDTSMEGMTMEGMDHSTMNHDSMDDGTMESGTSETMASESMGSESMDSESMDHDMMDHESMDHKKLDHEKMDHETMNHEGMNHEGMNHEGMDHGAMDHGNMEHGSMQGGSAPPDARDPDAYSGGYSLTSGPYVMPGPYFGDTKYFASVMVDRLEAVRGWDDTDTSAAYDLQASYGRDFDGGILKAEGHVNDQGLEEARTELLWSHAIAAYWNTQLGVRYDSGEGPDRYWLAGGIQGLAPYWFEVDLTAYVGEEGRTALLLETEYEMLLTQKLILQPRLEATAYGKSDAQRGLGSGLAELVGGVRLRYEIRRELGPYVGIERSGTFGGTANFAKEEGLKAYETRLVAGLRMWF